MGGKIKNNQSVNQIKFKEKQRKWAKECLLGNMLGKNVFQGRNLRELTDIYIFRQNSSSESWNSNFPNLVIKVFELFISRFQTLSVPRTVRHM